MTPSLAQRAAVLSVGAVLSLGLAACGGSDSVTVPDGQGGTVKVDREDEEVTLDTEGGTVTSSSKLPKDFPSDKVPLIEGDVVSSISTSQTGGGGFNVVVSSSKSAKDALDEAVALLTAAGYEKSGVFNDTSTDLAGLKSADYMVLVQVIDAGQGTTVSYTIASATS